MTALDPARFEWGHALPEALPGVEALLFTVIRMIDGHEQRDVEVVLLESGERRVVVTNAAAPKYMATGHLLYSEPQGVFSVPFDLDTLKTSGAPVRVGDSVEGRAMAVSIAAAQEGGTMALSSGAAARQVDLTWLDPVGNEQQILLEGEFVSSMRISPDGQRVALSRFSDETGQQIWVHDPVRRSTERITWSYPVIWPIWTSDESLAFGSSHAGERGMFLTRTDGSREVERLTESVNWQLPVSTSADGRMLFYIELDPTGIEDIWVLDLESRKAERILATTAMEGSPMMSPTGEWVAYVSNESGRFEVYLTSYRGGGQFQVSTDGAIDPAWSPDGRRLFYRERNRLMEVEVEFGPVPRMSIPRVVFERSNWRGTAPDSSSYEVGPDGRFLIPILKETVNEPARVHVALHWLSELERLMNEASD